MKLKDFLNKYLIKYYDNNNFIIINNNGNINLSISVSPKEETILLTTNQISSLFETTINNVYTHIRNIYKEGEFSDSVVQDSCTTEKEMFYLANDGKKYLTRFYNLDIVLAVGYRVKSNVLFHILP